MLRHIVLYSWNNKRCRRNGRIVFRASFFGTQTGGQPAISEVTSKSQRRLASRTRQELLTRKRLRTSHRAVCENVSSHLSQSVGANMYVGREQTRNLSIISDDNWSYSFFVNITIFDCKLIYVNICCFTFSYHVLYPLFVHFFYYQQIIINGWHSCHFRIFATLKYAL